MISRALIETAVKQGCAISSFRRPRPFTAISRASRREDDPTVPTSLYGSSKLMTEIMLRDASTAHGLRHVILRYFNVAGADPLGRNGQSTRAATHLIIFGSGPVWQRCCR
jgi:UDP-glucose 4-epimerase